jgi:hypothetical protein
LEIIDFDTKSAKKMGYGFGLRRWKNKISSKINLNRVTGYVFYIQNEFHDNRTRFGGFMEKNLRDLFWSILGSSTFRRFGVVNYQFHHNFR